MVYRASGRILLDLWHDSMSLSLALTLVHYLKQHYTRYAPVVMYGVYDIISVCAFCNAQCTEVRFFDVIFGLV